MRLLIHTKMVGHDTVRGGRVNVSGEGGRTNLLSRRDLKIPALSDS
jgi:hypothetical protein